MAKKKNAKILVLLDWSNIFLNIPPSEKLSITAGLDRVQKKIAQEVGEIALIFIFSPLHLTSMETETFYQEGFYIIECPKFRTKERSDKDTTDEILIKFANDITPLMPGITHLCLGSGDRDFCEMLRKAFRKRLKIMIITGDLTSLSPDLIELADINPSTGRRMVYVLSQSLDNKE